MKTSELTGHFLNVAVALAMGHKPPFGIDGFFPSTDWSQAGPIIEREGVCLWSEGYDWEAKIQTGPGEWLTEWDASPLVAAMRCYVASKLGDEVDIPEELQ